LLHQWSVYVDDLNFFFLLVFASSSVSSCSSPDI
jgi:hypothetical protein